MNERYNGLGNNSLNVTRKYYMGNVSPCPYFCAINVMCFIVTNTRINRLRSEGKA